MDMEKLEPLLADLPLYFYDLLDPNELEFSQRIRWICTNECPMYGKTWACPPGVGRVAECQDRCMGYKQCLMISTITEVSDISNMYEGLATRGPHEELTNLVRDRMTEQLGLKPYILSTEACAICDRCAYLDGEPCRFPEKMHPCVESHGINLIPAMEARGLDFQFGENIVTWFSLLFF